MCDDVEKWNWIVNGTFKKKGKSGQERCTAEKV